MTERELSRAAARRLAIIRHAEEVTGNVALTCRYFGISRQLYYTWVRRYEELGVEGPRPRSRRPLTSPNATSSEMIGKIIYLCKTYHSGLHPGPSGNRASTQGDAWSTRKPSGPTIRSNSCRTGSCAARPTVRQRGHGWGLDLRRYGSGGDEKGER